MGENEVPWPEGVGDVLLLLLLMLLLLLLQLSSDKSGLRSGGEMGPI